MTWWKGLIAGVLLLAVAGITVAGLRDRPPPATEVQVAKVRKGTISRVIIGAGKVEASTTVKISSNLSGDLVERPVELGDKVKKGQVLGRIDPRPYTAALKQAQAAVSAARADTANAQVEVDRNKLELERVQGLAKRGMASGAELDKAKADYNGAVARVGATQQRYQGQVAALENAQTNLSRRRRGKLLENTTECLQLRQRHQSVADQRLSSGRGTSGHIGVVAGNETSQIVGLDGAAKGAQLGAGNRVAGGINRAAIA